MQNFKRKESNCAYQFLFFYQPNYLQKSYYGWALPNLVLSSKGNYDQFTTKFLPILIRLN